MQVLTSFLSCARSPIKACGAAQALRLKPLVCTPDASAKVGENCYFFKCVWRSEVSPRWQMSRSFQVPPLWLYCLKCGDVRWSSVKERGLRFLLSDGLRESGDLPQTHPVHMFVVESVVEVGELWRSLLQDKSQEMIRFKFVTDLWNNWVYYSFLCSLSFNYMTWSLSADRALLEFMTPFLSQHGWEILKLPEGKWKFKDLRFCYHFKKLKKLMKRDLIHQKCH